jgi:hypothetical protein
LVQGAAGVLAELPKRMAVKVGENMARVKRAFDRIDSGEHVARWQVPKEWWGSVQKYQRADPAERRAMRERFSGEKIDPRTFPPYRDTVAAEKALAEALPINPHFKDELTQKIARGFGAIGGAVILGVVGRGVGLPRAVAALVPAMNSAAVHGFESTLRNGGSIEDAFTASDLKSLAAVVDAVPIARILDRFDRASGGTLRKALIEGVKGGGEGAVKGFIQRTVDNLIKSELVKYDPETGVFQGTGEAAGVSFLTTSLASVLASMLGAKLPLKDAAMGKDVAVPTRR